MVGKVELWPFERNCKHAAIQRIPSPTSHWQYLHVIIDAIDYPANSSCGVAIRQGFPTAWSLGTFPYGADGALFSVGRPYK